MILGSSGGLRLPSRTEPYINIRDTTPEGSEVYRVVGYVDMVDKDGVNHRKKFLVDIDYILLEHSCHLNQSEIGYDE